MSVQLGTEYAQYVKDILDTARRYPGIDGELAWDEILYPDDERIDYDPEFIEAFKTVARGETESPLYSTSLKEAVDHLVQESKRESRHTEGTRQRFVKSVDKMLLFLREKDIRLSQIDRPTVHEFIEHSRKRNSGATVQAHISRLKSIWNHAYQRGWVDGQNPFEKHVFNTTKDRKRKQPFTPDELQTLLKAVKKKSNQLYLLSLLGLYTGARISELVAIQLHHFKTDKEVRLIGIAVEHQGKTESASRWIPVPDQCASLLESVEAQAKEADSSYLFSDLVSLRPDGRLAYKATKVFGDIKKKQVTQRSDKGFHSFRVMMATFLQRADVSELVAAHLLGHSRKGLTMSYGYYSKGYDAFRLKEAQQKAGHLIDQLLQ